MRLLGVTGGIAVAALALVACAPDVPVYDPNTRPTSASPSPTSDGVLRVGALLPQTGSLAAVSPAQDAGLQLALKDINDAGGVNGRKVDLTRRDSGDVDGSTLATSTTDLLGRGSDVIIGPSASSQSVDAMGPITDAGVLLISPASTSVALSDADAKGLFWRTVPPDSFQGQVLAEVAQAAGSKHVAVLARNDDYGRGLAENFVINLKAGGGRLAGAPILYEPADPRFRIHAKAIKQAHADGIVLIGYAEARDAVQELTRAGIGPDRTRLFLSDGAVGLDWHSLPKNAMTTTLGTAPGAEASAAFRARLKEQEPTLPTYLFGAEAYDALVSAALAAVAAGTDTGIAVAAQLPKVTGGGVACTSFAACVKLLKQHRNIDYNGVSGPLDLQADGNPGQAYMGVFGYLADNSMTSERFVEGAVKHTKKAPTVSGSPSGSPQASPSNP